MLRAYGPGELGTMRKEGMSQSEIETVENWKAHGHCQPMVSICIPTFNRPHECCVAIHSCLEQSYDNFEIIITDNSANNDTRFNVKLFGDARISYFHNGSNIGSAASANNGISRAKGKYIKILMDDDLLFPDCLEHMVKSLEEHPTAGVVTAPMWIIDEHGNRICPRLYLMRRQAFRYHYQETDMLVHRKVVLLDFLTRDYPCCVPSGIMFRADALKAEMPFREDAGFAGDLDMCMRLACKWDFLYKNLPLSKWRLTKECHTARMYQQGTDASVFYRMSERILGREDVRRMFCGQYLSVARKAKWFCIKRAIGLNLLASIRSRSLGPLWMGIKTVWANRKAFQCRD